jgi:hypothetical protein
LYVYLASDTIPTGARLLKCSGTLASRTKSIAAGSPYRTLLDAVWCGAGNNATAPAFYRTSDSAGTTRNASGNYLVLPNLVGQFIRARDASAAVDPDGASREFGDIQSASVDEHSHDEIQNSSHTEYTAKDYQAGAGATFYGLEAGGAGHLHTGATGTGIGNETRPTNTVATICITY